MQRKPQQQTLSVRISEALRNYLERAKEVISSNSNESVSTSDVAKLLLESAKDDRLDDRLEMADLRVRAMDALLAIRRKWEEHRDLSRAEWIFLAQYVQAGCEELAEDPELPRPESFAQVLEAFLAVRALRLERGIELDRYYLGNLGLTDEATLKQRQLDPDVVPEAVGSLVTELRESAKPPKPAFVGRNLYVALKDESLGSVPSVNRGLFQYLPVLYRLAARGHWLRERRPVRAPSGIGSLVSPSLSPVTCGDYRLSILVTNSGDLEMLIEMDRKNVSYPLTRYPRIREFATLLARLEPGGRWKGREFFGYTNAIVPQQATRFYFRHRRNAITISFAPDEWQALKDLFRHGLALPELQPVLEELSLTYGEI